MRMRIPNDSYRKIFLSSVKSRREKLKSPSALIQGCAQRRSDIVDFFHRNSIDMDKPRACPCCGKEPHALSFMPLEIEKDIWRSMVVCECGLSIEKEGAFEAVKAWNTRVSDRDAQ